MWIRQEVQTVLRTEGCLIVPKQDFKRGVQLKTAGGRLDPLLNRSIKNKKMKVGDTVVELDQYKYELSTFEKPLVEVRDSL